MMKRIFDKNGMFLRDDTQWNENEVALDIEPNNDLGLYQPKWNGTEWVEGATEIPTPTPEPPTDQQLLEELSNVVQQLKERGLI
jgi:glycine/D-amino acid oxidase-like deaminating enzyme